MPGRVDRHLRRPLGRRRQPGGVRARPLPDISNDHDINGERRGYQGITIPKAKRASGVRGGILEMDEPEHRIYRTVLNPYLSPAAVKRWVPFIDEVVRACLDEKIEDGRIDFVDDLANIVPAVLTLAMLGIPLKNWAIYSEPVHASVYTPEHSPDIDKIVAMHRQMGLDLLTNMVEIRENPRPGMVNALLQLRIDGEPAPDLEILGNLGLVIGGGFDTTTALTAHALEWLSQHPDERERLSRERDTLLDSATEEFLRYYTPAPGDGRTFSDDVELEGTQFKEGERLWMSWAMANRDPSVFHDPNEIVLDRNGNRHFSFGLGVHRCIGSNVARTVFKSMLTAVLDRMPDYVCDPDGTVHYETIGVIQGMRNLPATFTPGRRLGRGSGRDPGEAPADLRRAGTGPAHHRAQGNRSHRLNDSPRRYLTWQYQASPRLGGLYSAEPGLVETNGRAGREVVDAEHSVDGSRGGAVSGCPRRDAVRKLRSGDTARPRPLVAMGIRPCEPVHPAIASTCRPIPGPTAKRHLLRRRTSGQWPLHDDRRRARRCALHGLLPAVARHVHLGCGDAHRFGGIPPSTPAVVARRAAPTPGRSRLVRYLRSAFSGWAGRALAGR